jgi:hypothetical protein
MLANEQEPKKKKKGLLNKMGLDQGSVSHAPPAPPVAQPGIFPGSAECELNERAKDEAVGTKVRSKLNDRKGVPRGR